MGRRWFPPTREGGTKKTRQEVKDKDYDRRASATSDVEPCCRGVLIDSPDRRMLDDVMMFIS